MLKKSGLKFLILLWALSCMACKLTFSSQVYTEMQIVQNSKYRGLGFNTFKSGFYAFTQEKGCVKCHGGSTAPYFASSRIDIAYENAIGNKLSSTEKLVDFANPAASILIEYAGNGHCSDTPCADPAVRPQLQRLIEDWANAELTTGGGGQSTLSALQFLTASLKVPSNLPSIFTGSPAIVRFALSQIDPPVSGLETATLEIEMQMIGTNIYKINKPRIVGSTRQIRFSGLYVLIKATASETVIGVEDTSYASNWHAVTATAGPVTNTPPVDLPLYYKAHPALDYLRIGFVDIH